MRYQIMRGLFNPPYVVELPSPICMWCGKLNPQPSMDGPLVCGACDMGVNADGTKKDHDYKRAQQHLEQFLERYCVKEGA